MSKELIDKLHQRSIFANDTADGNIMAEAADRIAELEAEVAALRYATQEEAIRTA